MVLDQGNERRPDLRLEHRRPAQRHRARRRRLRAQGRDPKRLRAIFDALHGQKHLVAGNHDDPDVFALPWRSIGHVAELSVEGQRIFLSHSAHRVWPGQRRGAWQLYGHSHGRLPGSSLSCDVGVDADWGYAPVSIEQIRPRLLTLPPPEMEADDTEENDHATAMTP